MKVARRKLLFVALGVLVVVAFFVARRMPQPPLVPYTSPPLTFLGKTARLQVLIPNGWVAEAPKTEYTSDGKPGSAVHPYCVTIRIAPANGWRWLPGWLRKHLTAPTEPEAEITIAYQGRLLDRAPSQPVCGDELRPSGDRRYFARCYMGLAGYGASYERSNKYAFDTTVGPICESLGVIQ